MPFTPYHFGAAAAIHSASPARVSFLAFCGANVLIDLEPLYYILTHQWPLHRYLHTFLGALFIAAATCAIGIACQRLARKVKLPNPFGWQQLGPRAMAAGALLGTLTHVLLDGLTHVDIRPFAPFTNANPLRGHVSHGQVQVLCLYLGLAGCVVMGVRAWRSARRDAQ